MGHNDHCFYENENKKITAKVCKKCPQLEGCPEYFKEDADRDASDTSPKFRWTLTHEKLKEQGSKNKVLRRKMKSEVRDKANNEYFCMATKEIFEAMPETRPVEVYVKGSLEMKKFVKKYLTFEGEI